MCFPHGCEKCGVSQASTELPKTGFMTIDASVARGDYDIGLSGIEDSFARRTLIRSDC
jgi:hypothetical protein